MHTVPSSGHGVQLLALDMPRIVLQVPSGHLIALPLMPADDEAGGQVSMAVAALGAEAQDVEKDTA